MKKYNTDFSMQSFWAACIASAVCYLGFETGVVDVQSDVAQLIIGLLISMITFFGYWWYRLSKIVEAPSFKGEDIFVIILGSFIAQWAGVVITFLVPLLGVGVEPTNNIDSEVPVFYQNCDQVKEYGDAPIYEGDQGYHPGLDRDGDGVGCEPWYGN